MEMARFVDSLAADVAAVAAVGDEQTRAAAERVLHAIRGSAGLRLLDALGEAALEISGQLPEGHVEVRLVGQDPALVYVGLVGFALDRIVAFIGRKVTRGTSAS